MDEFLGQNGSQNGEYYVPPKPQQNVYYGAPVETQMNGIPVSQPPKKKRKGVLIFIIVILVCFAVAMAGLVVSFMGLKFDGKSENSTSQSEKQDDIEDADDINNDSDEASANIVGSNEASKTDEYGNLTAAGVAAKVMDSCVGITVYTEQSAYNYFYSYGQEQNQDKETKSGEGSGVIMSESNGKTYIITCAHVIANSSSCKVKLNNGKEYDATVVGYDSQTDIGVLSIKEKGLKVAEFGDSKDIEVGENCIAIGCPAGLQFMNSMTMGIVSALDRPVSSSIGYKQTCIQVDAAINPGNSGGALFNMQGQVIGINSSKLVSTEYEGMGFAVPTNTAVKTANSLIKYGYVEGRAKLGIQYVGIGNYNNATAIISALSRQGYKDAYGAMVIQEVNEGSDLKGKVSQYDMIIAVDGTVLTDSDVITSYLSNHAPNDTCTLTIATIENNSIKIREVKCKLIEAKE